MEIKIKIGIVGAAGYTGGELIRLLLNHPKAEIAFALSRSQAGNAVSSVHTDLFGETDLIFTNEYSNNIDVLFLCLPHKKSKTWIESHSINDKVKIIDLGNDFRLEGDFSKGEFVYGLPEVNSEAIKSANYIANPGCFATAIQLALLPLAKAKLLQTVYTTGITGSTGAGQSLQSTTHFTWRANNISAYKTLTHQHVAEICNTLEKYTNHKVNLEFVPWRGDFTRGIFTSSTLQTTLDLAALTALYEDFYSGNSFVFVSKDTIDLKQVVNTNKCLLHLEKEGDHIVIHSVIDNLIKGASGQAVQNMNLMLGFEPTLGLKLKASAF
ncbi:N-acetyl-gamma-glutamyl-phosphate reductase [Flavobacterium sp. AS60]|uniref:N-acetyl-gamma-glutamyl-phosphate reductase n=1 Tax=Flavobacterium anseongense TaxID=2910677 RepID=UPI001F2E1195|nr:N-acetyl-gamma-glutamyl-phosphate reductase [Flavobacterium sp. AS60]MCF6128273.1 N-acetyl-gamma-glutamyl-phosphate reductase [Flavobacterium sp. AS60]